MCLISVSLEAILKSSPATGASATTSASTSTPGAAGQGPAQDQAQALELIELLRQQQHLQQQIRLHLQSQTQLIQTTPQSDLSGVTSSSALDEARDQPLCLLDCLTSKSERYENPQGRSPSLEQHHDHRQGHDQTPSPTEPDFVTLQTAAYQQLASAIVNGLGSNHSQVDYNNNNNHYQGANEHEEQEAQRENRAHVFLVPVSAEHHHHYQRGRSGSPNVDEGQQNGDEEQIIPANGNNNGNPPSEDDEDQRQRETIINNNNNNQNHNIIFGSSFAPASAEFDLTSASSPSNSATTPLDSLLLQSSTPSAPNQPSTSSNLIGIYDLINNSNNHHHNHQQHQEQAHQRQNLHQLQPNSQIIQYAMQHLEPSREHRQHHQLHPHHFQMHQHPGLHQMHQHQDPHQMTQHHREHQQQQQHHLAGNCKCDLTTDPSTCYLQCGTMTTVLMTPSHQIPLDESQQQQQHQQLVASSTFASPMTSAAISSGASNPTTATALITSPTTATATSMISSTTSIGPTGKMNPLDVTFLLYTRHHRDLVQELIQLNGHLASLGASTLTSTSSTSGSSSSSSPSASSSSSSPAPSHHHHSSQLHRGSSTSPISGQNPSDILVSISDIIDLTNETTLNLDEARLNSSLPFKIIIHGFGSGGRRPWVTDMVYKLLDYEDVNVIVVDWEKGAALPNYVQAAGNTRIVGHKIALLIKALNAKFGLTGNRYHLIGFSLGAHVAGFAGMEIRNSTSISRHWINRITGLDPASPLFEGYEANDRLDPSDAQFVDVIHSNGDGVLRGGFGSLQPMGHVDFYPNGGRVQVGCNSVLLSALSDIIYGKWQSLCNHRRALNFFMDSFESANKCRFRSFNCDSYESYLRGECFDCGPNDKKCSYMGYLANHSKGRGKMYLTTHEEAPFCANQFIIKIVGTKGFKTHWGKVEVTLVTGDGKNESFWLSSMSTSSSSSGSQPSSYASQSASSMISPSSSLLQSSSSSLPSTASTSSPAIGAYSSSPSSLSGGFGESTAASTASSLGANSNSGLGSLQVNQKEVTQQNMQSLIVAHPTLVNFTQIILRYTKYKGWIYSGDESWPIDKVFITDSEGQVKSFCGYNTILESHITTRLNLEPGNCTVIEPISGAGPSLMPGSSGQSGGGNPHSRSSGGITSQAAGLVTQTSGADGKPQQQQQQQIARGQHINGGGAGSPRAHQHQQTLSLQQAQQQQQQQSVRTPRLLASMMQAPGAEQQQQQSAREHLHAAAAMQRMLPPQHSQQFALSASGAGSNSGGASSNAAVGTHQVSLSYQIMAF